MRYLIVASHFVTEPILTSRRAAADARLPRSLPLVVLAVGAAGGIAADRYLGLALRHELPVLAAALLAWLVLIRRGCVNLSALALVTAVAACGGIWHQLHWNYFDAHELRRYAGEDRRPAALIAVAAEVPVRVPAPADDPMRVIPVGDRSRLEMRIEQIRHGDHWQPARGTATLLCEGHLLGIQPGDRLQVFAQLATPTPPQGRGDFDYPAFLRTQRQLVQLYASYPECVERIGRSPSGVRGRLAQWRAGGNRMLWHYLRDDRAGLAAAVLLGERSYLDRERIEPFVETGTVHLLAISGLHVGILAAALFAVLKIGFLPRRLVLGLICGLTLLYAGLTDAQPPVVRASILVCTMCLAMGAQRRVSRFNILAGAALVVLAINPAQLFQIGAQLSFLAVGTLMALDDWWRGRPIDPLNELIRRTRPWPVRTLRRTVFDYGRLCGLGLGIWAVALPLVMYQFHLASPIGALLTPLLIPPLTLALFAGMAVLLLGWFAPAAAHAAGSLADGSLLVLETTVNFVRDLPGGYYYVPGPSAAWCVGFYALLTLWLVAGRWRPRATWSGTVLFAFTAVGFAWPVMPPQEERLECTFISVGHGAAVLLALPDGRHVLYDAGRLGAPSGAVEAISAELWSRGLVGLDALVISHADADHYNAIPQLLERFRVGVVYVAPVMLESDSAVVAHLFKHIDAAGVPVRTISQGDRLNGGEVRLEVLHPPEKGVLGTDNANSIVLAVEYQDRRILLTGDLEPPGIQDVMAELPYDCDVLLAPHHGSSRSMPEQFAAWCTPEWTVASGGRTVNLAAARAAYNDAPSRLLHTAETGNVTVSIEQDGCIVRPFR